MVLLAARVVAAQVAMLQKQARVEAELLIKDTLVVTVYLIQQQLWRLVVAAGLVLLE
jgi:hypothetical protein